jgi:hypothetical protein
MSERDEELCCGRCLLPPPLLLWRWPGGGGYLPSTMAGSLEVEFALLCVEMGGVSNGYGFCVEFRFAIGEGAMLLTLALTLLLLLFWPYVYGLSGLQSERESTDMGERVFMVRRLPCGSSRVGKCEVPAERLGGGKGLVRRLNARAVELRSAGLGPIIEESVL